MTHRSQPRGVGEAALPRVWVTHGHVYIQWPAFPRGLRTCVSSPGSYLDDMLTWTCVVPDSGVELVPAGDLPAEAPEGA